MTVIANDAELEAALERALSLFGEGSTEPKQQGHLTQLLEAIQAYRPSPPALDAQPNPRIDDLSRRLNALDVERRKDRPDTAQGGFNTGGFIFPG
ncbi:MAG: hypothetical protein JWM33_465 [Caulobacteraceae bacterium]|nr:hypothetical protein [Caulobacteraceae bacterium]